MISHYFLLKRDGWFCANRTPRLATIRASSTMNHPQWRMHYTLREV